jgi:hypothetical protein
MTTLISPVSPPPHLRPLEAREGRFGVEERKRKPKEKVKRVVAYG